MSVAPSGFCSACRPRQPRPVASGTSGCRSATSSRALRRPLVPGVGERSAAGGPGVALRPARRVRLPVRPARRHRSFRCSSRAGGGVRLGRRLHAHGRRRGRGQGRRCLGCASSRGSRARSRWSVRATCCLRAVGDGQLHPAGARRPWWPTWVPTSSGTTIYPVGPSHSTPRSAFFAAQVSGKERSRGRHAAEPSVAPQPAPPPRTRSSLLNSTTAALGTRVSFPRGLAGARRARRPVLGARGPQSDTGCRASTPRCCSAAGGTTCSPPRRSLRASSYATTGSAPVPDHGTVGRAPSSACAPGGP